MVSKLNSVVLDWSALNTCRALTYQKNAREAWTTTWKVANARSLTQFSVKVRPNFLKRTRLLLKNLSLKSMRSLTDSNEVLRRRVAT